MVSRADVHLGAYVPPARCWVAKRLWAIGCYERELLEHAERWGDDLERACSECDRLELVVGLACLRGASVDRLTFGARAWWDAALGALGELGWPPEELRLASASVEEAAAPDVELGRLEQLRGRALQRAGARGRGRHRYRLLTAAAHVASLGIQRVVRPLSVGADGEIVAEHLRGALEDAAAAADLFDRPDVAGFERRCWRVARALLAPAEVA